MSMIEYVDNRERGACTFRRWDGVKRSLFRGKDKNAGIECELKQKSNTMRKTKNNKRNRLIEYSYFPR